MIVKLAWRNIWRNKRRTLITVLSVAFGVWLAATFIGIATASYISMVDGSTKLGLGHITIQPAGYAMSPSLQKRLIDATSTLEQTRKVEGVRNAVLRISGQAMFATASRSIGGGFWGIDPADESAENNVFVKTMVRGEMLKSRGGRGVVIGSVMAERLGLDLGKKLVFTAIDATGEIVSEVARVKGIFETGVADVDGSIVLLPVDTVRKALGYGDGDATMIAVYVADQRATDRMRDQVDSAVGSAQSEVLTWQQTQPEMSAMIQLDRSTNYVFQVLLGLLIAAGVLNTILMSVLERKREFGIMMAVGLTSTRLAAMVLVESVCMAVVGLFTGVVLTAPWYYYLVDVGIDVAAMYGDQNFDAAGVLFDTVMHAALFPEHVAAILCGVFGLTLVAGLYPAFRAGREQPVDAIKEI